MDGGKADDAGDQHPRIDFCASGAGLRPHAVDAAADHPGHQPRRDGRRFRHAAADAGEPDLDLSFRLCRLADSGRRRDGSLRRPAGFAEPAVRNHRRRAGVRARDRAGEFSVRTISARGRHLGHADVPDDAWPPSKCRRRASACGPASILSIGNIGMLLSSSPLAFVVEHWGWRAGILDLRRLRRRWWRSPCSLLVPKQPAAHADQSSPLSQMAEVLRHRPVASAARPDRAVAGVAGGLAGAAGIVGRSVADGGQGD